MSSIARVAISVFLSGAAGACTQTTSIQEFLDPTPVATTVPNPVVNEHADVRTADENRGPEDRRPDISRAERKRFARTAGSGAELTR